VLETNEDLRIIRPASKWVGPAPGKKPAAVDRR
jgi:hypothetical protein